MEQKLEQHNSESYHYELVGFASFKKVFKTLTENLPYYRISYSFKKLSKEIFYDMPNHLLADAGIALSKYMTDDEASLNVRKIYSVKELKKPSEKYLFGYCRSDEEPKDYSYQMAALLESSFRTPFSIDTESIVKQTVPIIEVNLISTKYDIICGTGYRAIMQYENVAYKDLQTGKKVDRVGITFKFPLGNREEKQEILDIIDRKVKGLALNNVSRFEIAKKLLFTEPQTYIETPAEEEPDEE